jgi:phage terminase Nu1 subunit (DNA packaging protein)
MAIVGRPIQDGGDPAIALLRAKAKAAREQAEARRAKVRADLAEGKVIPLEDARGQMVAMASAVRRALDLAPAYLRSDLTPEVREAATSAMRDAIHRALGEIRAEDLKAP